MALPYGSPEALEFVHQVTSKMTQAAWLASHELFMQYGSNLTAVEQTELTAHVKDIFFKQGLVSFEDINGFRNSQVTLLAPTGTISFIMDTGDSTGIEPVIAIEAHKTTIGGQVIKVLAAGTEDAIKKLDTADYSHPVFATSIGENCVSIDAHIATMAEAQKHVSGSISKTVNLPPSTTVQQIYDLYLNAWRQGIKAVAVYRAGSKMSEPLSTKKTPETAIPRRTRMPSTRSSVTHRFEIMGMDGYITLGYYDDGRIGEVFAGMQKVGSTVQALLNSWSIMVSIALQYGVPIEDVIRKSKGSVFEPAGITDNPDIQQCSSILDYVVRFIETTLNKEIAAEPSVIIKTAQPSWFSQSLINEDNVKTCPDCGNMMVLTGRCHLCTVCGTSGGCS